MVMLKQKLGVNPSHVIGRLSPHVWQAFMSGVLLAVGSPANVHCWLPHVWHMSMIAKEGLNRLFCLF